MKLFINCSEGFLGVDNDSILYCVGDPPCGCYSSLWIRGKCGGYGVPGREYICWLVGDTKEWKWAMRKG